MTTHRSVIKAALVFLFSLLLAVILNCSNKVTDPGGDGSGGGNDTTGPNPDITPPQTIAQLSLTYSLDDKAAYVEWSAPWDDTLNEAVSSYVIKYTYTDPFIWDLAIPAMNPPVPSPPGEIEQYAILNPLRGRNLYSAVQSVDEEGNASGISPVAMVHIPGYSVTGFCTNPVEQRPVEGLAVKLSTGGVHQCFTDSEGRYSFSDLAAGAAAVTISTGSADTPCYTIQDNFDLTEDVQRTEAIIPIRNTESPRFDNFLIFFKALTEASISPESEVIKSWKYRPVKCYIPPYVSQYGVDYEIGARRAAQRWMDKSDRELFQFVDEEPDTGIVFRYKSPATMGIQIAICRYTNGDDGHPLINHIDIVNNFSSEEKLYRVVMHELGHTLHFGHLPYPEFIMYIKAALPPDISNDEADAARLLASLPPRIDMAIYDEDTVP
jgi:hypothetical protein